MSFIECVETSEFSRVHSKSENFNVFNSQDDIYLVFTNKKGKFSFYFILFRRFTVQAKSQQYKRRQRSICDRMPGSNYMYSHRD